MTGTDRSLLDFFLAQRRDPLGFLVRAARESGDVVFFRLGSGGLLLVSAPDTIQEILVNRAREFHKAQGPQAKLIPWGRRILGSGLLISEGETWLRQRRMMQPAFHRERIAGYERAIRDRTIEMLSRWDGSVRDVHAALSALTLTVMAETIFGSAAQAGAIESALGELFRHRSPQRLTFLTPEWLPTSANRRTGAALRKIDERIYGEIAARRQRNSAGTDLLSLLVAARDDTGAPMSDRFVRDEVMSTLVAGHDTLSSTLTWLLWMVAQRPDIEARLVREIAETGDRTRFGSGDLAVRSVVANVTKEALRLFPPGKSVVRTTIARCEVAGRTLEAGTYIVMSQWVVHRDPRFFADPESFLPDRWASGDLERRLPRFAYFPFGGGPRLCLGYAFAETMLRVVAAEVIGAAHLTLDPDPARRAWDRATLRPTRGIWMSATRR
ncbi:MAG TPA: cytochrome P450 [Candidatus Limnocylindria bacterium]|nr:cytochrome P450 [Candidatus Limnocylindria bacterium]